MPIPCKKAFDSLSFPRLYPQWCGKEAGLIASHLLADHKARNWQVEYMLSMLDADYLVSLPKLAGDKTEYFHYDRSPENLVHLWCSWGRTILGWAKHRGEGHKRGFSSQVYAALQECVFTFPKEEHAAPKGTSEVEISESQKSLLLPGCMDLRPRHEEQRWRSSRLAIDLVQGRRSTPRYRAKAADGSIADIAGAQAGCSGDRPNSIDSRRACTEVADAARLLLFLSQQRRRSICAGDNTTSG